VWDEACKECSGTGAETCDVCEEEPLLDCAECLNRRTLPCPHCGGHGSAAAWRRAVAENAWAALDENAWAALVKVLWDVAYGPGVDFVRRRVYVRSALSEGARETLLGAGVIEDGERFEWPK